MTLRITRLTKSFGAQIALQGVDLAVAYGEVHALVGQNGSGKSTLIKVLSGYHQPDPGAEAELAGRPFQLGSAHAATAAGLRFVHQDLALVLQLSILDNVMLGRTYPLGLGGRIRSRVAAERVRGYLHQVGVDADVRLPVASLSPAERSAVAIARALSDTGAERLLLVLDEPTAALPSDDVSRLLDAVRRLREEGHGILLVSHHLGEVLDIADHITVLRDGRVAASVRRSEVNQRGLTELIVGHSLVPAEVVSHGQRLAGLAQEPVLRIRNLRGGRMTCLDLDVLPGEIVGVAGITGSGRESLASLITGGLPHQGQVEVAGTMLRPGQPHRVLAAGAAGVPGERARLGVFPNLSVRTNMTISLLDRHRRLGRIDRRGERGEILDWIERLGIVTQGPDAPIQSLSGGNQQKVLVARALRTRPKLLVLDDPTQGIDIGARAQIHEVVQRCAADGIGILLISTDSDELAGLADRILILAGGRCARVLRRGPAVTAKLIDVSQLEASPEPALAGLSASSEGEP
ncbi:MAG TPA: sugar ABC transporter ATP-binding protein [Streptosporangiaceae bacterium]|nr:sugar ABC transporter ATP-binding protein [Streptosporangiaceae bacterium]